MKRFTQFLKENLNIQSGTQYGSNPGGIHIDASGQKHYVKTYANPDQGKVEALAGKIYNRMGIHTANPEYHGNGVVSTPWNSDLSPMRPHHFESLNHTQAGQIGRMHAGAVLTKNWDIVGLEHDNILRNQKTGDLHAIDHGGAFHFRARGKPKDYGPDVEENHSLRNNGEASGHVFSTVFAQHPHAEHEGIEAARNMDMEGVRHDFQNSGLHNWEDLHKNFLLRHAALTTNRHRESLS